jgi:hypothetical protein
MSRTHAPLLCVLAAAGAVGFAVNATPGPAAQATEAPRVRGEAAARRVCASCHAFPPPDILPRDKWGAKVFEMTGLALAGTGAPKGREIPLDIPVEEIVAYYESAAPRELPPPDAWPEPSDGPVKFARHSMGLPGGLLPVVANVRLFTMKPERGMEVFAADMSNGLVLRGSPARPAAGLEVVGRVPNASHTEAVDLDKDGVQDLLVASLGGFAPGDYTRGSIVWLRGKPDHSFEAVTLASGLPRIADVRAADFDQDGDLDLVVAAFGWRAVGSTLLFENRSTGPLPVFVPREIDGRQGAIHVPLIDLDQDGRPDFVDLVSQHHETVVAFLNQGKGAFAAKPIYEAPHPGWGSSGIELVDLDQDGRTDVLVTNGDMFDEFLLKPYHGITWLQNRGSFPFAERLLAPLSGVHRAEAADLDGDGDTDIVACTLIPGMAKYGKPLPSLVWLEQVSPGKFERRTLEKGGYHATLAVGDVDGDGDGDVVTANFQMDAPRTDTWVEVWENLTRPPDRKSK